jgi:tetratricopeptide (TPR) repeat protein
MIGMAQTGWPAVWCEEQDYPQALAAADEAEEIYIELGDLRQRGQAVYTRAKTLRAMGELDRAKGEFERSLALRKLAKYTRGVGLTEIELGNLALELHQPQAAREWFEAARHVLTVQLPAESHDADLYDGTVASIGLARALAELGQLTEALEELERADESMAERGSLRGRGFAAEALGAVRERAGDPERATAAYHTALTCYQNRDAAGTRRVATRLTELGAAQ